MYICICYMKILFTGGGSGGHFYPIIAIAEQIEKIVEKEKLIEPCMYYMAPEAMDERMLYDHRITFIEVKAGKRRLYKSILNFLDVFKTGIGVIAAFFKLYSIYPDVVFAKGGFGSFPALMAARILRIPVVIHESDSVPGRVNLWAGKFADRIAVSYPETAEFFPKSRVAWTGQPVRESISPHSRDEAFRFLNLEPNVPVMLIIGGSQGAEILNDVLLGSLNDLLKNWQIIHQTGKANLSEVTSRVNVVVTEKLLLNRYHAFDFLSDSALAMTGGAADLVISRAGSSIFEIASWGVPSIIVPITVSNGNHQRNNAFNYMKSGACLVIEEANFSPHILLTESERIRASDNLKQSMSLAAKKFVQKDSALKIARELVNIAIEHGSR